MSDLLVELRGEVPREYVDVLDAVAMATPGASRMTILRQVLGEWVERKRHEAMLIHRVTAGNGSAPESIRKRGGKG